MLNDRAKTYEERNREAVTEREWGQEKEHKNLKAKSKQSESETVKVDRGWYRSRQWKALLAK